MSIKKIEIENYKGISNLEFIPKKINIIVGKNNTGKTSVLDAVNILFHTDEIQRKDMISYFNIYSRKRLAKIIVDTNVGQRSLTIQESQLSEVTSKLAEDILKVFFEELYRSSNPKKPSRFKKSVMKDLENVIIDNLDDEARDFLIKNSLTLITEENKHLVYYLFDNHLIDKLRLIMQKLVSYVKKVIPREGISPEQSRNLLRNLDYAELRTLHMLSWKIGLNSKEETSNVVFISSILENFGLSFQRRLPKDSEKLYQIEKILKEHNLIDNLESLDFDNVLLKTEQGIKAHTLSFLGDGFKCIIAVLWLLSSQGKGSIILFDEPEEHMHPGYVRELVDFFVKFSRDLDIQFFMTTHSSDLLDIFLSDDLEKKDREYISKELRVLKLSKAKSSITLAESLSYNQCLETKENLLLDLRGI